MKTSEKGSTRVICYPALGRLRICPKFGPFGRRGGGEVIPFPVLGGRVRDADRFFSRWLYEAPHLSPLEHLFPTDSGSAERRSQDFMRAHLDLQSL